jgi:hypothetical protein
MKREDWIQMLPDLTQEEKDELQQFNNMIEKYPKLLTYVLQITSINLDRYRENCKKQNNGLLREALGDAVHLLSMNRKPSMKEMANTYCQRIKKAIYPDGVNPNFHHQGERNFYEKMGWKD